MTRHSPWDLSPNIKTGHAALGAFALAPDRLHLNHGSFGALPRTVLAEQDRLRAHVERDPTSHYQDEMRPALRAMAGKVAARFGGDAGDWVFCENATSAVAGVLAGFPLEPGDEIVTTSQAYGAVLKAMKAWAARKGASLVVVPLPAISHGDDAIVEAIAAALTDRSRLLIVDHITSATATLFPVARIVERAHRAGVAVMVDGAHAPGQIALDVPAIGADWYTGNAHKWLFAPRGCGILWTAKSRQAQTLPATLSHGTEDGYTAAFDWIGTRDFTPWLCFEAAGQAHDSFGGAALMARNRQLAADGAAILCEGLGASYAAPQQMRAAMATILLHDSVRDSALAADFRKALAQDCQVIAPVSYFDGKLWLRVSAQIYNEIDDYRRCLGACLELRAGPFRDRLR